MTELEKIEKELDEASEAHDKVFNNLPDGLSFSQLESALEKTAEKIAQLNRRVRMLKEPEFQELEKDDDRMSLKSFIENVNDGWLIDYDGYGHYVKDNKRSNITIIPSDVANNSIRKDFDEIVWYNR